MALISRDPFARTELHREYITPNSVSYAILECDWCGSKPKKLYRYRTESDGDRVFIHRGRFCCKSCHDSHHS